jgi:methylthioribose-1-phosphate isomerase
LGPTGSPPTGTSRTRSGRTRSPCSPFDVAAPLSTIDPHTPRGERIPIEERDPAEVSDDGEAFNPAFDITPAELVGAVITEVGVLEPPYEESIAGVASG